MLTRAEPERLMRPILLIDGHPREAELMEAQFRRVNIAATLYFVADGEEAIEFLTQASRHERAPRPALIFLDLKLAETGGFEMLTLAKGDLNLARIPIIVMSASENGDIEKAYSLRANCCVRRPESAEDLARFVDFIRAFWLDMLILPN